MTDAIIGRDAELAELAAALECTPRRGGAVVVHGEPGIGKSVLLADVARRGRAAGFTVVSTTGVESETGLPFAALHDLLRPLLDRADRLAAPQRRALLSAFGLDDQPAPQHFLIALAALNLLADAAAASPVLLVADDVQWLDPPTHDVLAFLARRLAGDPVLLVAAVRAGHGSPLLTGGARVLPVRNLDDAASRRLLAVHAADLPTVEHERILREALGNPLALVELPAAARGVAALSEWTAAPLPLSTRLERAFAARLDELPAPARDALLVAAVDDDELLAEILAGAAALAAGPGGRGDGPGAAVARPGLGVDVLDPATAVDLVRIDGTRVRFRHPLVRSAVLQSESLHRRQRAHAALAAVLDTDPYRRTWHRAQAIVGPDDRVADELEYIHGVSLRRGAVGPAIAALERAAQLTTTSSDRGRRLLLAAEHAFGLGRADTVDRLVTAAGRNVLTSTERARMQWLREILNDGVPGDAVRVTELVATAVDCAEAGDPGLALNLLLGAALRCWWADTGPDARRLVAVTVAGLAVAPTDPRRVAALAVAEPVRQSRAVADLLAGVVVEQVGDADALRLYGMAAHAIAEPARSLEFLDRAEARLREQGRLGLLSHVITMGIGDRLERGDWDRALQAAEEGRRIAHDTGQPMWDTGTLSLTAMVLGLRGDNDAAQRMAAEVEHRLAGARMNNLYACIQLARGFGHVAVGRHAEAYSALRRLFDPADPCFHATERFHGVMYLAEAAVRAGRQDDARGVVAGLHREAATCASTTLDVHLRYADAVLDADADPAGAEEHYTAALATDLVAWPLVRARLQLAYGSWLRRQRRVAESRLPLRSALATLDVIGARTWAENARGELRAAGEADRVQQAPAAVDVLSPQEAQIARLVADGLSNREIGEQLYLSPRTVGSHLYRMFPKLGITSRGQLAARLRPPVDERS